MEKKGELLNQLAIISDLTEKMNLQTESRTLVLELSNEEFVKTFDYVSRNFVKKTDVPETTFSITLGAVSIVFNKSSA